MKQAPAFQMYAKDWLSNADVRLLTRSQKGIYMDMLCFCWEGNGLPESVIEIGKLLGLSRKEIKNDLPFLLKLFLFDGKKYQNSYLLEQRKFQDEKRLKSIESNRKRWLKVADLSDNIDPNAFLVQEDSTRSPSDAVEVAVAIAVDTTDTDKDKSVSQPKTISPATKTTPWQARLDRNWTRLWRDFPKRIGEDTAKRLFYAELTQPDPLKLIFLCMAIERFSEEMHEVVQRNGDNKMVTRLSVWLRDKAFRDHGYQDLWELAGEKLDEIENPGPIEANAQTHS